MSKQQQSFAATAAAKRGPSPPSSDQIKKKRRETPTTILSLDPDIVTTIFAFLDMFDLVRCSLVCKLWVAQCRMKMGMLVTGVGHKNRSEDFGYNIYNLKLHWAITRNFMWLRFGAAKRVPVPGTRERKDVTGSGLRKHALYIASFRVIRLWSLDSYKCIEEYSMPDMFSLVDFDFDESKIVGLIGSHLCIWRRNGKRSIFPSLEGKFVKGSCMRYFDPEAVVGCDDGAVRVFDMYSRKCSQIIRMHYAPITCLCLSEDQLIMSGSTSGSITMSDPSSVQQVATLRSSDARGIRTLCFNPSSQLLFAGSAVGYAYCWDLRYVAIGTRKLLWSNRVSPNVIYSLQHMHSDTSTLAVGGIDGILRLLNQNDGSVVSSCVMGDKLLSTFQSPSGSIQRRKGSRLPENIYINIDLIPKTARPSITCLAVGMKKIVTTHNTNDIRLWKFKSKISL
ncbi:hypothetical protein JHK84_031274 [Glycine max]|nr:hypothetical protein JHK86_031143 [Glycine max]KAG5145731.1 hypothetical protein JHK84_031274 [Glycine max]